MPMRSRRSKFLLACSATLLLATACSYAAAAAEPEPDWAALWRYHNANASLPPPAPGESRVVFFGDSITDGWPLTEFFPGKPYINRGISGQTTQKMLVRFRADVIDLKPKVVVILAGTNDIAQNDGPAPLWAIEDNLASMVDLAEAHGIRPILCSVLPATDYPWRHGLEPAQKIIALNAWIKDFATRKGILYLDYFSAMKNDQNGLPAELSPDGVHPNHAGYAIMQPLAQKAIDQVLAH